MATNLMKIYCYDTLTGPLQTEMITICPTKVKKKKKKKGQPVTGLTPPPMLSLSEKEGGEIYTYLLMWMYPTCYECILQQKQKERKGDPTRYSANVSDLSLSLPLDTHARTHTHDRVVATA